GFEAHPPRSRHGRRHRRAGALSLRAAVRRQPGRDRPAVSLGRAVASLRPVHRREPVGLLCRQHPARGQSDRPRAGAGRRSDRSAPAAADAGGRLMPTLARYATRLFFVHVGLMLIGFVALLQLLDILSNADDVLSDHGEDMTALLRYAWLRLPESVVFM